MPTEILDARLIDPASGRDEVTNIYCQDGKVVGIGQPPAGFAAAHTLNAQGLVAAPGLVDLSVALREPAGEAQSASIDFSNDCAVAAKLCACGACARACSAATNACGP